ncbi:hypothetical protein RJ639_023499 [Escallonia herrerae]|uniref:glutaredoxin-dependent peroxiredoxin n=1 Tax=Escallonia herrerae TaxID=1293975 RepID=A0AA88UYV7_9ASTE|nr:hypothetical protein RJ639_023499 [Escallonia herrerae]
MDSVPVNWEALDALVIEFAKSEHLMDDSKFIELLRRGTEEDRDSAIHCLRTALAPCALDAYPEAYEEFKHVLLAFIYDKDDQTSPVANEWSKTRRVDIAGLLSSVLRAHLHAYDPVFSMALRYLISIHNGFCFRQGFPSPIADLTVRLLLEEREPAATLQESLYEAPPFDEVDIQALAHAVELTRQGAVDSLRFAKGDLCRAFQRLRFESISAPKGLIALRSWMPGLLRKLNKKVNHCVNWDSIVYVRSYGIRRGVNRWLDDGCWILGAAAMVNTWWGSCLMVYANELSRMRLDASMLDELVYEYCVYRGIVGSDLAPPSESSASGMQFGSGQLKVEPGCCVSRNWSEVDSGTSKHSDGEVSINNSHMECSPENNANVLSIQNTDIEERYPSEPSSNYEDCSTSGTHHHEISKVLQRNRTPRTGERNKRKRWRGRHEELDFIPEVLSGNSKQELSATALLDSIDISKEEQPSKKLSTVDIMGSREDKYEIMLGMKELAGRGMAAEVVEEINAIDPEFFAQNHVLLFQLKQVEFLKLVGSGDHSGALKVASSHLGPLAASDPTLLKPLKETLLALLRPNEAALREGLPLFTLATSLQHLPWFVKKSGELKSKGVDTIACISVNDAFVMKAWKKALGINNEVAVGKRLGIEEPQLMKIIRATLYMHGEWFKLQMCKDSFEGLLKIDTLKEVKTHLLADADAKNADTCTHDSSQVTVSSNSRMQEDGESLRQVSPRDACDENAVLKVMEFLAMPRADAIHLLAQYNGNAETVIQQIFA